MIFIVIFSAIVSLSIAIALAVAVSDYREHLADLELRVRSLEQKSDNRIKGETP